MLVRPSYVLGGRAMEIVFDDESLHRYMQNAVEASPDRPILVDKFLEDAIEVDVDAISDGTRVVIGGIMEHIEEAGIHSGDSACILPPPTLGAEILEDISAATKAMASELGVIGLMNVQYAVKDNAVYVIEVNPRASRTAPFVSKAIGVPLAKLAAKVMAGVSLEELGFTKEVVPPYFSVKAPVFPFNKFPGTDMLLSPEMRSTGEVMGIDEDLGTALLKAYSAAGMRLPLAGTILLTFKHADKRAVVAEAGPSSPWATTCSPRTAPGAPCVPTASPASGSTRSTRAARTSSTRSRTARSTWSSTRRTASSSATTTRTSAPPPSTTACPASRRSPGPARSSAPSPPCTAARPRFARSRTTTPSSRRRGPAGACLGQLTSVG